MTREERAGAASPHVSDESELWYKDAVIYEVHVRAFYDSSGDGIGDFRGLAQKLDYIQALGVTAVWLLPFYPSPLKDDGYDIADYKDVHPDYGTLADFEEFLHQAHSRGLKVITELVLNHTSDQHPWFRCARLAPPGSVEREFYVWSDSTDRYRDARVIFQDFEPSNWAWDPVARAYYWHRFYTHQPDLNYENPRVLDAMLDVIDFWLNMGVDGLRLDAVPYLAEAEGTSSENLPATHQVLKQIRRHVDERFRGRMLLAEANQWPEEAAAYFGNGDECHMAFHFPLMPRLFMSLRREHSFPIKDILSQTPDIPATCQWAIFLRNHDELTLEMVTEEERLYMWRAYAHDPHARLNLGIRRRLAPLLGNSRRRMELMNALLLSMPGTPVLYYGDEIGMGDNIYLGDRNGVRTPMQWSTAPNAGFSDAHPQRLYLPLIIDPEYHFTTVHVEAQERSPYSYLKWTRRLLGLRKRHRAFGRGTMEFVKTGNSRTLAFMRCYGSDIILVIANLSRFSQRLELDLAQFAGRVPFDMFGRTPFPAIGPDAYPVMLGPHGFQWFSIESMGERGTDRGQEEPDWPRLQVTADWTEAVQGEAKVDLEDALPAYLDRQSWHRGMGQRVLACHIEDVLTISRSAETFNLVLVRAEYAYGDPDLYLIPLAHAEGDAASHLELARPGIVVARTAGKFPSERHGLLYDVGCEPGFLRDLFAEVLASQSGGAAALTPQAVVDPFLPVAQVVQMEPIACIDRASANTIAAIGDSVVLKLFRRVEEGINPEVEIETFLTALNFEHAPRVSATLQYASATRGPITLATLQNRIANDGSAWDYTLEQVEGYFVRVEANKAEVAAPAPGPEALLADSLVEVPAQAAALIGPYLDDVRLLGRRTAELHRALASARDEPTLAPEPFTDLYQRSLYHNLRTVALAMLEELDSARVGLQADIQQMALKVITARQSLLQKYGVLHAQRIEGWRIRCHGDYQLTEVLRTGHDFAVVDFEGEATAPVYERRLKAHPLTDVVSLLRSLDYAPQVVLLQRSGGQGGGAPKSLQRGVNFWRHWVGVAFLQEYRRGVEGTGLFPSEQDAQALLPALFTGRIVHEIRRELSSKPDRLRIPLHDMIELLGAA